MIRHHGYEDITLGADDCTAHGRARTEAMLLILCGISGGRVLAQDGKKYKIFFARADVTSLAGESTTV